MADLNDTFQEASEGEISAFSFYFTTAMLALFCVVGACGNSLAVIVYARKKDKLTSTIFILALASIDLFTCAIIIPMTMYMEYVNFMISSDSFCKIYNFLQAAGIPFSAFMMAAIAVDRYLCICHPFLHALNDFRAKVIIVVLAAVACVLGILAGLAHGTFELVQVETLLGDVIVNVTRLNNTNNCHPNYVLFSESFVIGYQHAHLSTFFVSVAVVSILYFLIYQSVIKRRKRRMEQKARRPGAKKEMSMTMQHETSINDGIEMTSRITQGSPNGSGKCHGSGLDTENNCKEKTPEPDNNEGSQFLCDSSKHTGDKTSPSMSARKSSTASKLTSIFRRNGSRNSAKEKLMIANLKTAAMLFVVSLVFIVTFLPAMLVILKVLKFNPAIFYLYFINNVSNPIIYAFMNRNFRDDLKLLLLCQKNGRLVRYR